MTNFRGPSGPFRRLSDSGKKLRDRRNGLMDSGADTTQWFENVGPVAHGNGWPVYPESKAGKRKPAQIQGKSILTVKDHHLDRKMPTDDLVAYWATWAFEQNTALQSGDAADIVIIDTDILDPAAAAIVETIADEVLGRTPFKRNINDPKFAMVYRRPRGRLQLTKKIFQLEEDFDGKKQLLEIKDAQPLTIFGNHNTTGRPVRWFREASPLTHRPEDAPLVNEEMVRQFLIQVNAAFPLVRFDGLERKISTVEYCDTDVGELRVPRFNDAILPAEGMKLDTNRKAGFLLPRSGSWAVNNAGIVAPMTNGARQVSEDGIRLVAQAMAAEARSYVAIGVQTKDEDLTERTLMSVIVAMVRTAAEKLASGEFNAIGTQRACTTTPTPISAPAVKISISQFDDEFSWLPAIDKRLAIKGVTFTASDAELAKARALIANRGEIMRNTSRAVRRIIDKYLMALALWDPEGTLPPPTLLLKAPTGAGKTTALLEGIARFKAAHPDLILGPILMLLPGYSNIAEVAGREDLGVWTKDTEDRAKEILLEAGGFGINVMTYKGKLASGCKESEKVELLQRRGISTANLCYKAEAIEGQDEDGHRERSHRETWCRYHPENPALDPQDTPCQNILQRFQIAQSDLVLAPHSFIHVNVPKVLSACQAVVIDERIWDKTIGTATIPLSTFERPRGSPPPTKEQWRANPDIDMGYTLGSRADATKVLLAALREGRDPAGDLLDIRQQFGNVVRTGTDLVEDALAVTGRGQRDTLEVAPGMDISLVREMADRAQGKHIAEEHRAWTILAERMKLVAEDREVAELLRTLVDGREPGPLLLKHRLLPERHKSLLLAWQLGQKKKAREIALPTARGSRDARLQFLTDGAEHRNEELRISWRRKRNFGSHPTLFLDASGSLAILEKLWGRKVDMEVVKASEHRRVLLVPDASYSKTGLIPTADDLPKAVRGKAFRITLLRDALYTTSLVYGFGGVLAGAALGFRRVVDDLGWAAPENLHWVHYGALRGLDFAKSHVAAISIGSIAPAWRDIDAYVGALSYDDPSPETPIDYLGTGLDGEGKELIQPTVEASYPARDGGYVVVEGVADFTAPWASEVYHQIREEELNQFGGRLRAVYREGRAPVWIVLGKVLPDNCVVDEVISLADLARPLGRATRSLEAVRQSGGLVCAGGTMPPSVDVCSMVAVDKLVEAFSSNARLAEGCHEVTYRIRREAEERKAFINAASGSNPVATVAAAIGSDLREPPRLARAARTVPFSTPKVDPDRIVYGVRELAVIGAREEAIETGSEWIPEMPAGTRAERLASELEAKVVAQQRIELGNLDFDYSRLGIKSAGMAVDIDTFLLTEALLQGQKMVVKEYPESEAIETSLPAPAVSVAPVRISWSDDPFESWEQEPANTQDPSAENVVALRRP